MFAWLRQQFISHAHRAVQAGCLWIVLVGAAWANDIAELEDAAARMQYAYYTQDARALQNAIFDLESLHVPDDRRALREYHIGISYWRMADVSSAAGTARAQALGRCEDHLQTALRDEPRFAEALAVRSLCTFQRNDLLALGARALKRGCVRQNALQKARELAPRNPRVLYIEAMCAEKDGDVAVAIELAQSAQAAFEQEQLDAGEHAGWGQADTTLLLAQLQLRQGNRAAARDCVEQALILAPDYVAARELLTHIAGGR